jgi:hypothetical protein
VEPGVSQVVVPVASLTFEAHQYSEQKPTSQGHYSRRYLPSGASIASLDREKPMESDSSILLNFVELVVESFHRLRSLSFLHFVQCWLTVMAGDLLFLTLASASAATHSR